MKTMSHSSSYSNYSISCTFFWQKYHTFPFKIEKELEFLLEVVLDIALQSSCVVGGFPFLSKHNISLVLVSGLSLEFFLGRHV